MPAVDRFYPPKQSPRKPFVGQVAAPDVLVEWSGDNELTREYAAELARAHAGDRDALIRCRALGGNVAADLDKLRNIDQHVSRLVDEAAARRKIVEYENAVEKLSDELEALQRRIDTARSALNSENNSFSRSQQARKQLRQWVPTYPLPVRIAAEEKLSGVL